MDNYLRGKDRPRQEDLNWDCIHQESRGVFSSENVEKNTTL